MTKNLIPPNRILAELRTMYPVDNHLNLKQIHNARSRLRSNLCQGRTELQQLMTYLERDQYVYWHRVEHGTSIVKDMFWAHPDSIELLNTFPIVLLIDSTYKTTRYRYPLVEIVGVTSTELTFSVAFAYVNWEKKDNFAWVLEKLRGLFRRPEDLPKVIITDCDMGIMNALACIFPGTANLLCQFHIKKNVRAKARMYIHLVVVDEEERPMDRVDEVMEAFQKVVHAKTDDAYELALEQFESISQPFDNFITYVKKQWTTPYKERFVDAWINRHMHLGNTTTNRVKSAHSFLQKLLQDSRGDLCKCWDSIAIMLRVQHSELKRSFEHSLSSAKFHHWSRIYDNLKSLVASNVMDYIANELKKPGMIGIDSSECGCVIRTTHGLPCKCELASYVMNLTPFPLETIHPHWKRLNFRVSHHDDSFEISNDELNLKIEVTAIQRRFDVADHAGRVMIKQKMRELAFPDTTYMCPPPDEFSTKRDPSWWERVDDVFDSQQDSTSAAQSRKRPTPLVSKSSTPIQSRSSTPNTFQLPTQKQTQSGTPTPEIIRSDAYNIYISSMPEVMHRFVDDIVNVESDSNCGFRCIAALLGRGEDAWNTVRNDLMEEVQRDFNLYCKLFSGMDKVTYVMKSLMQQHRDEVENQMIIPECSYLIANKYKVVLVCWSPKASYTVFPFQVAPIKNAPVFNICFTGDHFVQIVLKEGFPMPSANYYWNTHRANIAKNWVKPFTGRLQRWKLLTPLY